jgi:signal transduction histidine kinase
MRRFATVGPLDARKRATAFVAGLVVVFLTGVVDAVTGPRLSVELLYLVPVAAVSALVGAGAGLVIAVGTAPVSFAADARAHHGPRLWDLGANAGLRVVVFVVVVALVGAVRRALDTALDAERQQHEFLSITAEQLVPLLSKIGAGAQALSHQQASPNQQTLLAALARESQRAEELGARLVRVARLDQHEDLPRTRTDVLAMCVQEAERAGWLAPQVRFTVTCAPGVNRWATLNVEAIREALGNLLDNASRFAAHRVDITISSSAGKLIRVTVADDGTGVPAGEQERIFERFVSLDHAGGVGLGLAIARALAREHGGDIVYQTGTFVMTLPRA